ncbi:MAG TPA: SDR family NAD(P)-dependent oxidoreductase [Polyangiaceae bacterium]|nr:SDR family NAD(P)-dependent oxidoreductase [Polyangiaceae bacterium]
MEDVAIVTGASGALGAEVARALSLGGQRLVLFDRDGQVERLERLAASLGGALCLTGDATDGPTWARAMDRIRQETGAAPSRAALLAGAWRGGTLLHEETSDDVWRTMMATNLETAYRSLRALLPPMVAARRGSIVVVGSRAVEQPWTSAGSAAYAAAKSAVVALARATASEVLARGVRVNAVLPSTLDTPANRAAMPAADPALWVSTASLAAVIAFLLGDGARDISGAAVPVYGRS